MKTHLIIPAAVGALLLSASLAAATDVTGQTAPVANEAAGQPAETQVLAQRCTDLGKRFDTAIRGVYRTYTVGAAMWKRAEAGVDCQNGKLTQGIAKLEDALQSLPVKTGS